MWWWWQHATLLLTTGTTAATASDNGNDTTNDCADTQPVAMMLQMWPCQFHHLSSLYSLFVPLACLLPRKCLWPLTPCLQQAPQPLPLDTGSHSRQWLSWLSIPFGTDVLPLVPLICPWLIDSADPKTQFPPNGNRFVFCISAGSLQHNFSFLCPSSIAGWCCCVLHPFWGNTHLLHCPQPYELRLLCAHCFIHHCGTSVHSLPQPLPQPFLNRDNCVLCLCPLYWWNNLSIQPR